MPQAFLRALNCTANSDVHTGDEFSLLVISSDWVELAFEKANSVATSPMLKPKAALGFIPKTSRAIAVNIVE